MSKLNERIFTILIIVSLFTSTAVMAAPKSSHMHAKTCHHHSHKLPMDAKLSRLSQRLNLSEQQTKEIETIYYRNQPKMETYRNGLHDNHLQMKKVLQSPKPNKDAIASIAKTRGELVTQLTLTRAQMKQQVAEVLTLHQKSELEHMKQHRWH